MAKFLPVLAILVVLVGESLCQVNDQPLWLYRGDDVIRAPSTGEHPYLPPYIDDIKLDPNTRVARSFDSHSSKHHSGSHSTSSGSRDTGATHPGYNRRNARSIQTPPLFPTLPPTRPRYPPFPIYVRTPRDIKFQGLEQFKKPSYNDIVIPNWNPNVKTDPRQILRIKSRKRRGVKHQENTL